MPPLRTVDPISLWQRALALRTEALSVEGEAIRAALVAAGWQVRRAAALLGLHPSSMVRTLDRHPALREEIKQYHAVARTDASAYTATQVRTRNPAKPLRGATSGTHSGA